MTTYLSDASSEILRQNYRHVDHSDIQLDWTRWHAGASLGLAGGFLIGFFGLFLAGVAIITGGAGESSAATWLIIAAVPLLAFGAHSLDKIDEQDKARRHEHCKNHGLTDEQCRENSKNNQQK